MVDRYVQFFKALSDATRQEILSMLEEHEMTVTEICTAFEEISQPTVSHHLQILKNCDLVGTRRDGRMIYYSVSERCIGDRCQEFFSRFSIRIVRE